MEYTLSNITVFLRNCPIFFNKSMAFRAEEALKKAVAKAIADHKRMGDPIVIWRDGNVVKIPAEQIEV
jgi:hypothetical protein